MFEENQILDAYVEGYTGQTNQYIPTPNCHDAHLLGVYACNHYINGQPHKSRGYTWKLASRMYRVEYGTVTPI